jgi:phosphopantetheinyl transferase
VTLAWCAKEAAYKFHGQRGIDFIAHLPITNWAQHDGSYNITINIKPSTEAHQINLKGFIFNDFALSLTEEKIV